MCVEYCKLFLAGRFIKMHLWFVDNSEQVARRLIICEEAQDLKLITAGRYLLYEPQMLKILCRNTRQTLLCSQGRKVSPRGARQHLSGKFPVNEP